MIWNMVSSLKVSFNFGCNMQSFRKTLKDLFQWITQKLLFVLYRAWAQVQSFSGNAFPESLFGKTPSTFVFLSRAASCLNTLAFFLPHFASTSTYSKDTSRHITPTWQACLLHYFIVFAQAKNFWCFINLNI